MKKYYDVVIIGASISGMEAAKELSKTKLSVLVVEREKTIGNKACGHGITSSDVALLPKELINFPLQKLHIHYKNRVVAFPKKGEIISSIDRRELLKFRLKELKKSVNVDFEFGASAKIYQNNEINVKNTTIKYKYLIGADGSNSTVRKYLNIESNEMGVGIHYMVPKKFDKFEIFFDDILFETGFAWIFPNDRFTSIGCGGDVSVVSAKKLQTNFSNWLKKKNIDVSGAIFQGSSMNCDYRGHRFRNIFLIGDAAGLVSGLTGKGMYAGIISARQVVNEILGLKKENLIKNWLKKKGSQEFYLHFLRSRICRKILFAIMFRLICYLKYKQGRESIELQA